MSVRSKIESLNLTYSQIRNYLQHIHGIKHPGKGMAQLIDTIVGLDDVQSAVKSLKRLQDLQDLRDGIQKTKKTKGTKRKADMMSSDTFEEQGDEEEDHPIMVKLKEELALRGKTTTSQSWPLLVGRLLKALQEEA